ncbi:alkaline shock response membrane anchor protein AmaP [Pseudonocardiaceae bacterium YIM PH 21723]|nr:alkaline shock response membrane anchor protein AmaP [Pseudonocardiaceae bacterium YIM PH 21723]
MSGLNRPAGLNRTLLGLLGVLVIAGGAFLVLANRGLVPRISATAPIAPGVELPPQWVLIAAAVAAVTIGLMALRWIVAQLVSGPRTYQWRLHEDRTGRTDIVAGSTAEPFAQEVEALPGVTKAKATVGGRRTKPLVSAVVETEPQADLVEIRRRMTADLLPRLRSALDLDELPMAIEFRVTGRTAPRVS